jgi:small subunit ribosomal protein S16
MAVKIRLQRKGRKKQPFYQIVIADSRTKRDGRFIERIGIYNPMTNPATIELDREKAFDWLMKGAQPTDTVRAILKYKGVIYRRHLQRGVSMGVLTQEQADQKYSDFIRDKESAIAKRKEETKKEKAEFLDKLSGTSTAPVVDELIEEIREETSDKVEGKASEEQE